MLLSSNRSHPLKNKERTMINGLTPPGTFIERIGIQCFAGKATLKQMEGSQNPWKYVYRQQYRARSVVR